ncbi:MAG TPA: iron ABC transporter permease [Eubacteriaceae bacterium]|nr:iron ABC transporter permease [Eubacteriaceae bacterium]
MLFIVLVSSLLFAGCSASSDPAPSNSENASNPSDPSQYPITLSHAFGETVIENKPERIASISWGNQDVPLALDLTPVGVSKANYGVDEGSYLLPWTKEKYEDLGVDNPVVFDDLTELDYEGISNSRPDVILAAYSGITQEEYNLLSQIAPVVAYPDLPWQTFWRDQIRINSTALGLQSEGEQLVSDLDHLIDKKTSEYDSLNGKTAAFFYFNPSDLGNFYVYLPEDPRAAYLLDLGLSLPESVISLSQESESFALEMSSENMDLLSDVDIIVTYGTDSLLEQLQSDPLIGSMPAVKRGSVAIIEDNTPLAASGTPSALSIPATIDEYLSILAEAGMKVQ